MSLLKEPIKIKDLELSNRLVMPPMATEKSGGEGLVSDELRTYYDEKTKGGYIGLVITEHAYISPEGKASVGQLSVAEDAVIPGLKELTSTIHKNGSKVFAQISHAGGTTNKDISGYEPMSSSDRVVPPRIMAPAKIMNQEDIDHIIKAFALSASRVKEAGFDGVEIHSAHGYLLNQFYSPIMNNREDEYRGSTIEGRIKLHLQVIKAVRELAGKDYPIALRLGASDYMDGGTTIEDSIIAAKAFEQASIDVLDITGGFCGYTNPNSEAEGYFSELSKAIKREVSIPVIVTGGVKTAQGAEKILEEDKADLVGVGRSILKDSQWAKKAMEAL